MTSIPDIDQIANILNSLSIQSDIDKINFQNNIMATFRDHIDSIPQFNGDQRTVGIFLTAAQATINRLKKPDDELFNATLFQAIRNKLVGPAQAIISTNPNITWEEIKEEIKRRFGDQRTENTLTTELLTLTQNRNEKPLDFGERCKDFRDLILAKIATTETPAILMFKSTMYNDIALQTFLKGTDPELSRILRCKNPNSLEEALRMTAEEENYAYVRNHFMSMNKNTQKPMIRPLPPQNIRHPQMMIPPNPYQQFYPPPRPINSMPPPRPMNFFPNNSPNYFQLNQPNNSVPWNHRFPSQPMNQYFRPQFNPRNTNVFRPNPNKPLPKPTPMDTSSSNSKKINTSANVKRPFQPRTFTFEELHYQENMNYPYGQYTDEIPGNFAPYYESDYYDECYDTYENFEKEETPETTEEDQQDNNQNFQNPSVTKEPT